MSKLLQVTTPVLSAALLLGLTTAAAQAAAPTRENDHVSDVVACGDPDNPDFVLSYEADISALFKSPLDRGNTDATARRGQAQVVETYSVAGHTLMSKTIDNSHDQSVVVDGDRLIVTAYSSGVSTWSLDGRVISRSSGTLRLTYSANHNGTPDDRRDDFDFVFGDVSVPGAGHNRAESPDPCAVLAPFAT